MNKEFIPYQEALALKELGFNKRTLASYHTILDGNWVLSIDLSGKGQFEGDEGACLAPTYSQAFRFFREKYRLHCWVGCKTLDNGETVYIGNGRTIPNTLSNGFIVDIIPYEPKPTPEEAELACLQKLIEIVKPKQHE